MLRSQGIPSRVALGYAVQTRRHGAGSSLLILGNDAHAWPEMYLDGVGWVTFDIYPEHSDEPPQPPVDEDLETTLGEIARKDPTGGQRGRPATLGLRIPWELIGELAARARRQRARGGVPDEDRADGCVRGSTRAPCTSACSTGCPTSASAAQPGETRERHAARLADKRADVRQAHPRAPARRARRRTPAPLPQFREPSSPHRARELRRSLPFWRRRSAPFSTRSGGCSLARRPP